VSSEARTAPSIPDPQRRHTPGPSHVFDASLKPDSSLLRVRPGRRTQAAPLGAGSTRRSPSGGTPYEEAHPARLPCTASLSDVSDLRGHLHRPTFEQSRSTLHTQAAPLSTKFDLPKHPGGAPFHQGRPTPNTQAALLSIRVDPLGKGESHGFERESFSLGPHGQAPSFIADPKTAIGTQRMKVALGRGGVC
jgi:hypothetical protein